MNVKEILNRTPPPVLYHYTTQQGLLGIINNKEIWATHTQYLNDAREFIHAVDIFRQELDRMIADPPTNECRDFLSRLSTHLRLELQSINVCVCSFSSEPDSLPQWRAYGGAASGFAIGFSGEFLRKAIGDGGWLSPVLYEEGEQQALVYGVLHESLDDYRANPAKSHEIENSFIAHLYRYAPLLKHTSFKDEREWRIVTRPRMFGMSGFDYRAGKSSLVPYFRISLSESKSLGLEKIVVGPTPHPQNSLRSVRGLLMMHSIKLDDPVFGKGVLVLPSDVPYRNW